MAYTAAMRNATGLWHVTFPAAVSAVLIESLDCLLAGCGIGTAIIACRLSAICAIAAFATYFLAQYLYRGRSTKTQFWVAFLTIAPLGIFSGTHLSQSATLIHLLPHHIRFILPSLLLAAVYGTYFWGLTNERLGSNRFLHSVGALVSAVFFFWAATYFKKLHYPLAVSSLFFCWINLQGVLKQLTLLLPSQIHRFGTTSLLAVGLSMMVWPVSLEDTFIASDQGILARDLTHVGRAHTIDELVEHAVPHRAPSPAPQPVERRDLPHHPGRSIVLISVDALRPDHLGTNGYHRNVSPNIDALLKDAVVFENAYSTAPTSSFSIPSIHTGVPMEERLKSAMPLPPMLATHFNQMGYETIGLFPEKVFSVGPSLMAELKKSSFGFSRSQLLEMDAIKDVETALQFLRAPREKPLFMWVHFYDPHLPYSCHQKPFGEAQIDCYDAEISYLDSAIQPFLIEIKESLNNPIITFTADHGEAFGEHGRHYHSTDLYNEQIKVPLAFVVPGIAPQKVKVPVSNCNIFDTLLSLVQREDISLKNDLRAHMVADWTGQPVRASIGPKRAIVYENYKLICENWPKGACALFDLQQDPQEKINLAAKQVPQTVEMLGLLKDAAQKELHELQNNAPRAIILGRLKRADAKNGLIALANSPSSPYAIEAAQLLAFLKTQTARSALSQLEKSHIKEVAAWASIGNGLLHNDFSVENITPYVHHRNHLGYWSAVVLGKNGHRQALYPLLRLLKNEEPYLRAQAALALGKLGNKKAVPGLIDLLHVKQSRWAAIDALGELEDQRALKILSRLEKNEPDLNNLPRYQRAIERIGSN